MTGTKTSGKQSSVTSSAWATFVRIGLCTREKISSTPFTMTGIKDIEDHNDHPSCPLFSLQIGQISNSVKRITLAADRLTLNKRLPRWRIQNPSRGPVWGIQRCLYVNEPVLQTGGQRADQLID